VYTSPNIVMLINDEDEMGGTNSTYVGNMKVTQHFGQKISKKEKLGRPGCRWDFYFKIYLRETGLILWL